MGTETRWWIVLLFSMAWGMVGMLCLFLLICVGIKMYNDSTGTEQSVAQTLMELYRKACGL